MRFTEEFDQYLERFRSRLKRLVLARGAAMMSIAGLAITVIAVAMAIRNGFPDDIVITARLLLIAVIGVLAYRFVYLPRQRVADAGIAADIERRSSAFGGRVETYLQTDATGNPLRDLLAEDAAKIASDNPPEAQIERKEFTLAWFATGTALAALLFLAIAGPGNYAYGVRHLWFGWAMPGLLPPQSIEVVPGDDGIRLGGTVSLQATMQGFDPAEAFAHARFAGGEWQQVSMADEDGHFTFTFFSVRQPMEYYVSAANNRSQTYRINVVDLPVVENLALTYEFPDWTEREPETQDPGGDVRAIVDTRVTIQLRADREMTPGELIVDDEVIPLETDGNTAEATFTVAMDGQYFIAAKVGGEQIRLTDDYFISLLEDEAPTIEFARPGRDWSASSIEEVTARVTAVDDFALESLALNFSVNGGDWQVLDLPVDTDLGEIDHVFFLESMEKDGSGSPLTPGDLISYYAVATDRENTARTDIFFIDVQPFDRRYSQSQQAGGGGGGGGGQQSEISDRQREIIVSTWNLIREQNEKKRGDDAYVSDNAALLSRLQETLRGQVETLAERAHARQLTATDEDIAVFAEHLSKAGEAMISAAERLGVMDLDQAILPEQEALQHLLAAEAVFTDISVSMQANNNGGRGGQAGRDLSEMFELEMDLEKNQYESGSNASPDAPQQDLDEAADELGELARRQEQLARNLERNQTPTPAQRWQQEMLRRDVEELRDRLERMQEQSAANQQQGQSGQNGQSGQAGESGESSEQQGQQGQQGQSGNSAQEMDELRRRVESAVRAMNDADEAMRNKGNPDDLQRAAAEAQRQLEGARQQALEDQQQMLRAAVGDLAERADELYDTQAELENRVQEAVRSVLNGNDDADRFSSGLSFQEENEIAAEKRALQAALQSLEQDARNTARNLDTAEPRAAEEIRKAIEEMRESEIDTRIAVAAAYIEQGEAIYIAASESAVTEGLRELRNDMQRAEGMTGQGGAEGRDGEPRDGIAATLAETQALRRELQRLAEGPARNGQAAGEPQDGSSRGQPGEGQAEGQARAGQAGGRYGDVGRDDRFASNGIEYGDIDFSREFDRQADDLSRGVIGVFNDLRANGATAQDIDELRRLVADIRASDFSGNPDLLDAESRAALSLVEQLELALSRVAKGGAVSVHTNAADEIPEEHKQIIADYYRRLGQAEDAIN